MAYDIRRNIVVGATTKQLWILRDFQEKYHPELPCPRLSLSTEDMYNLDQWYGTLAKLYLIEVQGLPI